MEKCQRMDCCSSRLRWSIAPDAPVVRPSYLIICPATGQLTWRHWRYWLGMLSVSLASWHGDADGIDFECCLCHWPADMATLTVLTLNVVCVTGQLSTWRHWRYWLGMLSVSLASCRHGDTDGIDLECCLCHWPADFATLPVLTWNVVCVTGQVTGKVQNSSECSSGQYLINCRTFCNQSWCGDAWS